MSLDFLDLLAISAFDNFDNILIYCPYSSDIVLEKNSRDGQFGYETVTKEQTITTVGIIKYAPSRRWLEKVGIHPEESGPNGQLPMIGLFLNAEKFKKGDIIRQVIKDFIDGNEIDISRKYEITDEKSFGDLRNVKKVFLLVPVRGENTI